MNRILHCVFVAIPSLFVIPVSCAHDEEIFVRDERQPQAAGSANVDWRQAEKEIFSGHVQLTFGNQFVKAGESYFSPDDKKIIFQAVEAPPAGQKADEFYAMFVADVKRDAAMGNITGIENLKRLSPKGSANTCGWFHPKDKDVVIFASTIVPPTASEAPGYRGADKKYLWSFPPEMHIVRCNLAKADGTAATLEDVGGYAGTYQAEGSLSNDGRHLLYCSLESNDGDLFVLDLKTKNKHRLVQGKGYDGGPFFSPDGKRICYRSDRLGDNLLQLFVADLAFNDKGEIVGVQREYQLTDNECVNWCPFWTNDGRRLVYSSSALGETNFEIFMLDADPGNLKGSTGTVRYGTAVRRLTHFDQQGGVLGSDVLPALSHDGKWMIWASRRGPQGDVQLWTARFTLDPEKPWKGGESKNDPAKPTNQDGIQIADPDTGMIYIYDMAKHTLSKYNPKTHELTEVSDEADTKRFMELFKAQEGAK